MIDRCVRCDYSLEGLPTIHPCPECGRENDRESVAVWDRVPTKVFAALFALTAMVQLTIPFLGVGSWPLRLFHVAVAGFQGIMAWVMFSRRAKAIVISQRAVELVDGSSKVRSYSMQNVARAGWSFVSGRTTVTDRHGRVVFSFRFLSSNRANRRVVHAINTAVARRDAQAFAEDAAPAE